MATTAASALKALKAVADESHKHVCYSQPEMLPGWQDSYDAQLMAAAKAALDAGSNPQAVYKILHDIAAIDLDSMPPKYMAACVEAGLSPDADVGGESLLHNLLNHPFPLAIRPNSDTPAELAAALAAAPPGRNPAAGSVTLNELLARKPKPNVEDAAGNTALHMLVACMVQRVHFPDPKLPGKQHGLQEDEEETIVEGSGSTMHQQQQQQQQQEKQQQDKQQQDGEQEPQRLEDNDAARAAYGQLAFRMLLEAGWEPGWRNHNGYTVSNLIEAGLARYQTELYDLQDPEGVAQTTVSLLSEKAPERRLQEFLDHKVAGIRAVVDALQVMHGLAATAEQPRKTRSAASLVLLWLLLLGVMLYIMYGRQRSSST